MKKILLLTGFLALLVACEANKTTTDTPNPEISANASTEVWEQGIQQISGTITKVTPEKDGQTIHLVNNKGIEYTAVISIPNLGDNDAQYRKFNIGEQVTFKGEFVMDKHMAVREVLEVQ